MEQSNGGFFTLMMTVAMAVGKETKSQLCDLDEGFESDMHHPLLIPIR